jgi:hypothetical protein
MTAKGEPSQDLAEILRGIEVLIVRARALNQRTLSYLLDMARLETIRLSDPEQMGRG